MQVLLRWGIERGCSVVPKSTNHHHQKVNMDLMSWSLTKEQFNTLNSIQPQVRPALRLESVRLFTQDAG